MNNLDFYKTNKYHPKIYISSFKDYKLFLKPQPCHMGKLACTYDKLPVISLAFHFQDNDFLQKETMAYQNDNIMIIHIFSIS